MGSARRVVVLVSGADSEILVAQFLNDGWTVLPLYVRCGFRWEAAELVRVRCALRALRRPRLERLVVARAPMRPLMAGHWGLTGRGVPDAAAPCDAVFIPGRNMVLLTEAWLHAVSRRASAAAIGTLKGNPFPDATPRFRAAAQRALNLALAARVRVLAPFAGLTKRQVLARAGDFPVELAFSCLAPRRGRACRRCSKCAELAAALRPPRVPRSRRRAR